MFNNWKRAQRLRISIKQVINEVSEESCAEIIVMLSVSLVLGSWGLLKSI